MIRLCTLGALDLRDDTDQEIRAVLSQPKRVALLAYLALSTPRGAHRRDTLLALFWPEHDAEHARNSLSQSIHVLRRSLGSDTIVGHNGDALRVEFGRLWCDAVAFDAALDGGRLAEAVHLYRGDLLDGFHIANAAEFERWLTGERERLALRITAALEELANEKEAAGDFSGAADWWRRLAARDPYSSRVALRLIRALAAAGEPAAAVRHARTHETLVREDLNIAPDLQIAELVRRLRSDAMSKEDRPEPRPATRASATTPGGTPDGTASGEPDRAGAGASQTVTPTVPGSDRLPNAALPARTHRVRRAMIMVIALALLVAAGGLALNGGTDEPELSPIRSLAVLPLENLSGDSMSPSFGDGMHDALITELARYPELTIISRLSVLQYRGTKKRPSEIADELKVDGLVVGTLLWERGRVRMNAHLVHGPSDRQVWARSYNRDLRDVLALQGELADAIAREVRVATTPPRRSRQGVAGPRDSVPDELYLQELYLRGRHAELSRNPIGIQTAREAYRRAVERDSSFALGYAGLAAVYGFMADLNYAPMRPALDSARMMARRAAELDSSLAETRTALAVTLADARQFEDAEREFRRAIEIGPSNPRAHYWYSILLVALGRGEEGLQAAKRAEELDPFAPRGVLAMQRYAGYLATGDRPHRQLAVTERRPILKLEPGEPWARGREAEDLAEVGRCSDARSEIGRAQQLVPADNLRMLPYVGGVYWYCGEPERARALLEEVKRRPGAYENGLRIAMLHALFGEKDSAFVWIPRTEWTIAELSVLRADRRLDALRADARYAELLRQLGLQDRGQN